jgi:hypothetical protein
MQYMLLIYNDPSGWESMSEADQGAIYGAYGTFTEEIQASGKLVAGDALQDTSTATSVRVRDGETLTTDGPFAETKEVLGGYYLIDVETLDEALEWGAKIPGATYGTIEVRPVVTNYETMSA